MRSIMLSVMLLLCSSQARANVPGTVSDVGVAALLVTGIAVQDSWENRGIAAGTQLVNFGLTFGLKKFFSIIGAESAERPDGSGSDGMPSGHTSHAFTGAGNICLAKDSKTCAYAMAGAASVGTLRVLAKRHTWEQVGWGMGLGLVNGVLAPKLVFTQRF